MLPGVAAELGSCVAVKEVVATIHVNMPTQVPYGGHHMSLVLVVC
jgi:hypothetical protein